ILTTDSSFQWQNRTARRYIPSTDSWSPTANNLPVDIRDGPAVLLPYLAANGGETAWYTGEYGFTAYYNPYGDPNNPWSRGPDFPALGFSIAKYVAFDTPAAVLPPGQVLIVGGQPPVLDSQGHVKDNYPAPYTVWEFSPNAMSPEPVWTNHLTGS